MRIEPHRHHNLTWSHSGILHFQGSGKDYVTGVNEEFAALEQAGSIDGTKRSFIKNGYAISPSFKKLIADLKIERLIHSLLERNSCPIAGDISNYIGETTWHSDVREGNLPLAKVVFYSCTKPDGFPFSYVPGSHKIDASDEEKLSLLKIGNIAPDRIRIPEITVRSGDVVIFHPRLLHAVFDCQRRGQIAALYAAKPETAPEQQQYNRIALANIGVL